MRATSLKAFVEPKLSLLVIIATYNEIDSLPRLVHQLAEVLPDADILVIDDASPDGTGDWCERAKSRFPKLSVLHRQGKLGLGSASIAGFAYAKTKTYELVATLDADLSHDPVSLAEMAGMMSDPANSQIGVMLGSRYVEGGGIEGWPLTRRLASKLVNWYARLMLGLNTKDNSGAFRVYRVEALKRLDVNKLKSSDFAYLEEILWRLDQLAVGMKEFPIVFRNREFGRSKTSTLLGLRVVWQITMLGLGLRK